MRKKENGSTNSVNLQTLESKNTLMENQYPSTSKTCFMKERTTGGNHTDFRVGDKLLLSGNGLRLMKISGGNSPQEEKNGAVTNTTTDIRNTGWSPISGISK